MGLCLVELVMTRPIDRGPLVAGLLPRAGARLRVLVLGGGRGCTTASRGLARPLCQAGLELFWLQG